MAGDSGEAGAAATPSYPPRPRHDASISLPIYASKLAWINAVFSVLIVATVALGFVVGFASAAGAGLAGAPRGLRIAGLCVMAPPACLGVWLLASWGLRMALPRQGQVELLEDRLVIHDRWMLRRPVEIFRSEVESVDALPKLGWFGYSPQAWEVARQGLLLGPGDPPNVVIRFHERRVLTEAVVTPPTKTALTFLSRWRTANGLLIHLKYPDAGGAALKHWLAIGLNEASTPPKRLRSGGCARTMIATILILTFLLGLILFIAGATAR